MSKIRWGAAAVLAMAIAQSAGGAAAQPAVNEARVVVRYADLNLATADGAREFRDRVANAVSRVNGEVDPRDLGRWAELRKAKTAALAAADAVIAANTTGAGATYASARPVPDKLGR
jgi:UrcA family protein